MEQSIIEAIWSFEFSYYTLDKNGTSDIPRLSAENNAFPTPCRSPGHHLQKIERHCRCQNRRTSGRGSRTVRLGGW